MAIVTLCPQCHTGFTVLPEHLSRADGWVRCGRCAHVFAVDQHLYEMDDPRPVQEFIQPLSRPTLKRRSDPPVRNIQSRMWLWLLPVLATVLLIQVTLLQRHWLAARVPELRPALRWLCQPLACVVQSLKDPEQVSMESSSFKRLADNRFAFEGVVRNPGDAELATPSLELSLTSHGQVSLRKVIGAQQLGLPDSLPARRTITFSFDFSLDPALSAEIDGFKALLFYP
ncbi:MAG: DUF3426 domain-containing protein [Limnohabitans sp.]|nr:DUF3426 domain-containing protein [Limnohabitans sp.]